MLHGCFLKLAARLALFVVVVSGAASCAHQPAASDDPLQKEAAIRRLLELTDSLHQMRMLFLVAAQKASEDKLKEKLNLGEQDTRLLTTAVAETVWEDVRKQIEDGAVKIYAASFTHQEILDIYNFYQTPTGRKVARTALKQTLQSMQMFDHAAQDWKEKMQRPGYGIYFLERVKQKLPESLRQRLEAQDSLL
jgi:hypothetical protein